MAPGFPEVLDGFLIRNSLAAASATAVTQPGVSATLQLHKAGRASASFPGGIDATGLAAYWLAAHGLAAHLGSSRTAQQPRIRNSGSPACRRCPRISCWTRRRTWSTASRPGRSTWNASRAGRLRESGAQRGGIASDWVERRDRDAVPPTLTAARDPPRQSVSKPRHLAAPLQASRHHTAVDTQNSYGVAHHHA
jgi:hypothetical protein